MESIGSRKNSRWKEACRGSSGGKRQVLREAVGMATRPLRRSSPSPAAEKGPGIHKGGAADRAQAGAVQRAATAAAGWAPRALPDPPEQERGGAARGDERLT